MPLENQFQSLSGFVDVSSIWKLRLVAVLVILSAYLFEL